MGPNDSVPDSMTHQTKKKRVEDQPFPTDAGQRPIQLQRRRVWRACGAAGLHHSYSFPFDHTYAHNNNFGPAERRSNVTEMSQLLSVQRFRIPMYMVTDQGPSRVKSA